VKQKLLALFSFVLILDPSGILTMGTQNVLFALLVCYLIFTERRLRKEGVYLLIAIYTMVTVTFLLGKVQGFEFNYGFTVFIYRTFVLLILLFWIDRLKFLEAIILPTVIVAIISLVIYYITITRHETDFWMRMWEFSNLPHRTFNISLRTFLGHDMWGVYYRSAPIMLLPLALYANKVLNKNKRNLKTLLIFLLLSFAILFSGTRGLLISGCGVIAFSFIHKMANSYFWRRSVPFILMIGVCILLFVGMALFLLDPTEDSNIVRMGHVESYIALYSSHPLILFFGQGAGSLFFSIGFGEYTPQVEWTYVELLRMFGIPGFILLLILFLFPAYKIWKQKNNMPLAVPFLIGYLFYLFNASTNPLLLGSNGLLVLLTAYSFAYNSAYRITKDQLA